MKLLRTLFRIHQHQWEPYGHGGPGMYLDCCATCGEIDLVF